VTGSSLRGAKQAKFFLFFFSKKNTSFFLAFTRAKADAAA
jgi:hypothetical protein